MPPVHLEKVLRHAERELVHQSHLRPTDLLDIYRRFLNWRNTGSSLSTFMVKVAGRFVRSGRTS